MDVFKRGYIDCEMENRNAKVDRTWGSSVQ